MTRGALHREIRESWIWLAIAIGSVVLGWLLTYAAGGTKTPVPHVFYIPIILAAGAFGVRVGLVMAIAAGVVCGPLMPLDVATSQAQRTTDWLIRLGFFVVIALVVGTGRNRLLHLSRARQTFLTTVSHELRTPLASVVGFASLLTDKTVQLGQEERDEFASLIHKEASELSDVVDHYILEGRLSDSALFIDTRPTDLRDVVDIVLAGLPGHIRETRFDVEGGDVVCTADPLRLRQVLRSVFNNALAYTNGRVHVMVATEKSQGRIKVFNGDSHKPRSSVSQLVGWTSLAQRTDSVMSPPLGVGLAVSRDLVHLMGGELHYDVNGTTSYELRLPLHTE